MSEVKVLKFWATWCKPCTTLSTQLEGLDITNYNIDDTESQKVASKYKIRSIPTLIFLKDEQEVHRHSGVISKSEYLETLKKLNAE